MKSKIKKLKGTSRQLDIEMSKESVDKVYNEVLADIRKTAVLPGFRKGNAPLDLIQKKYGQDAADEVKQRLIPLGYQRALETHDIRPVSYPEISGVMMTPAGTLSFTAKVDSHPEVTARKYKGLKVSRPEASVSDKEVDEALDRIRGMNAEYPDIDGPIKKGDFGICDVETFIGSESIAKKRENMWVEADKDVSLLGMGEELCGMGKGDEKDIEVTLPENYPDKKYAGKKAVFRVKVKETKEKKLPELDDEFAKKIGKDSMADVRSEIKAQLAEKKEANSRVEMKNQIMGQLLKRSAFDIPETMVKRQLKVLMEKAESELTSRGVQKEAIEGHKEKLEQQLRKEAEDKVRIYFILDEIAKCEDITVGDSEVDDWLRNLAGAYNQEFDKVREYYEEHGLMDGLTEQLREEKTLDFLLAEAVVTEKK